jgi:hypothetical protein
MSAEFIEQMLVFLCLFYILHMNYVNYEAYVDIMVVNIY